ncbi:hypothetical protein TOPH_06496 [Tolypocladium ophioglossoides CBS 100239]|uniref:Uncharacterized protein n=1 Tax=Tolypocladium ophioglossoides (strain CBS 100239) TaxID=1163406 RepID=A0A0L0N4I7_TOLOC|nr:hypothetical protein TOPH_06496 [Tolypocladium ophioglossoides CBS 100239]
MVAGFTRLVSVLAVGAGVHSTTQVANATTTGLASQMRMMVATGAPDKSNRNGPIARDGGQFYIPGLVDISCRYANVDDHRQSKLFRISMTPHAFHYDDWCETAELYIKEYCGARIKHENVKWMRCGLDGKDLKEGQGSFATFELHASESEQLQCVNEVLPETVPGAVVYWMGGSECYEVDGFETED